MKMQTSSAITFLSFADIQEGRSFLEDYLGLTPVYDPGWAVVYQAAGQAFIGAVDASKSTVALQKPGGVLISLTVPLLEPVYERLLADGRYPLSPIKTVKDLPLRSFFLEGPQGYAFEIQQFTSQALCQLF